MQMRGVEYHPALLARPERPLRVRAPGFLNRRIAFRENPLIGIRHVLLAGERSGHGWALC